MSSIPDLLDSVTSVRRELRLRIDRGNLIPKPGELFLCVNVRKALYRLRRMGLDETTIFAEKNDKIRSTLKDVMQDLTGFPLGIGIKKERDQEIDVDVALGGRSVLYLCILVAEVTDRYPEIEDLIYDRFVAFLLIQIN